MFDSHCHLQFFAYNADREEVIKRAQKAGIKMICVGTEIGDSQTAIALAEKYPNDIWATVGFHPNNLEKFEIKKLRKLAQHPKVVAIGECGLDYYRFSASGIKHQEEIEKQKDIFIKQIELAQELNKAVMIHCRPSKEREDAYQDLIEIYQIFLDKQVNVGYQDKIVHFFAGSLEIAKKLLEKNFYFTFGGVITFSRDYDEIIKYLPLEKIILETDAPYVAPQPCRGRRNEPVYIIEVVKKLAEIKGIGYKKAADQTTQNALKIFRI